MSIEMMPSLHNAPDNETELSPEELAQKGITNINSVIEKQLSKFSDDL